MLELVLCLQFPFILFRGKKADACPHKNRCGDVRPGSTALDYGPFV